MIENIKEKIKKLRKINKMIQEENKKFKKILNSLIFKKKAIKNKAHFDELY